MKNFLILILLVSLSFAREHVAIIDFKNINVTEDEAKALTQRLTTEMIKLGEYTVLERSEMQKVLKEQKFQYSGCVDTKCAVEIGVMLGAKYIVVGSVSKVGSTFSIDSRLINVETGESYDSADFSHTGQIDYLLIEGMKSIAYQLNDMEYTPKTTPIIVNLNSNNQSQPTGGNLFIDSSPQGADVLIDGAKVGTTPLELKNYPVGEYILEVKKKYYEYKPYKILNERHSDGSIRPRLMDENDLNGKDDIALGYALIASINAQKKLKVENQNYYNENEWYYPQLIKISPFGKKNKYIELICTAKSDCSGECGGTKVIDRCGICSGDDSSCKDDCGVVYGNNKDKDCDGVCFGENKKQEYCFDANRDGDGDIKTRRAICQHEVEKDWINNCSYLKGDLLISSQLNDLHSIEIGRLKPNNISHPVNMNVGIYELSAKSTYLFKEFEIRKNVQIFEDEMTTIYIKEDDIADRKKIHRNKVFISSGAAFALWLTWALVPYDI